MSNFFKSLNSATASSARKKTLTETQRVLQLPIETYEDLIPGSVTSELAVSGGTIELRPIQELALHALKKNRGGFFPIGVGHGKSFIACLAGTVLDVDMALILAPASTLKQLERQYEELKPHFRLKPATFMSYSMLSQPTGSSLLESLTEQYNADKLCLVCDEAHRLKRLESARTKRVIRFIRSNPEVSFIALSGTMSSKSLKDFSHIAAMALRLNSPVPRDQYHLNTWSECIDVDGKPGQQQWRMIHPLATWAGTTLEGARGLRRKEVIRKAFQKRLRTAPGVVASRKGSLGCSLIIKSIRSLKIPLDIMGYMNGVVHGGATPSGDVITDDVSAWRIMRYLSSGFYYQWVWPDGIEDKDWLLARKTWNRHVRAELEHRSSDGYDSPLLVSNKIDREVEDGQKKAIHRAWIKWKEEKQKPAPPTESVWVSDYLVDYALSWMREEEEPVILWYESAAVGERLKAKGVSVYGAGEDPPTEAHNAAMSIRAHGIGKNLQSWSNQLVLEPPTGGLIWEQMLGRCHRQGQQADEVKCAVMQHTQPFQKALTTAFADAKYISDSSGNSQKLLYANVC